MQPAMSDFKASPMKTEKKKTRGFRWSCRFLNCLGRRTNLRFRSPVASTDATVSSEATAWKGSSVRTEKKKSLPFRRQCRFLICIGRISSLRFRVSSEATSWKASSMRTDKRKKCRSSRWPWQFLNRQKKSEALVLDIDPIYLIGPYPTQFILDPKDAKKEEAALNYIEGCNENTELSNIQETIYRARRKGNMQLWIQSCKVREAAARRQDEKHKEPRRFFCRRSNCPDVPFRWNKILYCQCQIGQCQICQWLNSQKESGALSFDIDHYKCWLPLAFRRFMLDPRDAKKEEALLKFIDESNYWFELSRIQETIYMSKITGNMQLWMHGRSIREAAAKQQQKLSRMYSLMKLDLESEFKPKRSAIRGNKISNPIIRDYFENPYNMEKKERAMIYVENCRSTAELEEIISSPGPLYSNGWSIHNAAVKRMNALCPRGGRPIIATRTNSKPMLHRVKWSDRAEMHTAEVNKPPNETR